MSQYSGSYAPQSEEPAAEPSTTDVARDEAAGVGQHAREAGGQVAQTASDQARQVAAETSRQARDLLSEAQGQASDQASVQQQKAAQQLHSVADELGQMAANGGQSGVATEFARQAADRMHGAASWIEQREPADLLDEVRNFARRRPGAFLIGAAVAGLAAGRLTRGLKDRGSGQPDTERYRGPAPAIPAATTVEAGAATATVYPPETAYPDETTYQGGTTYQGETAYPTETGPADPAELGDPTAPAYPAAPGYPADTTRSDDFAAYPADPIYQADPVTPAEPAPAPRFEEPR
jgi:hypothetical protein